MNTTKKYAAMINNTMHIVYAMTKQKALIKFKKFNKQLKINEIYIP